ncbi:MAG: hypothetical protein WDM78_16835 [Puia sp.]
MQEWIAGIHKQNQEQQSNAPCTGRWRREGHNVTNGYELGDTIKQE